MGEVMDIGTGIAIAGVWVFAGMIGASKSVTGYGALLTIVVAGLVTVLIK